ncbi:hypothetical protein [Pseudoalteromonas sp. MMG022]|uniref:hypothetical protein n=1 Tax=Pseudoalteromonas sp. MMG022 TaxID=2909978 RepID=UPI001F376AD8|nr:hypothetical protein [Pseudoalteromonas sp. MMG022]MCF6437008.1 hypothetical protein [Pseudoalteromonas sp. MMG022]
MLQIVKTQTKHPAMQDKALPVMRSVKPTNTDKTATVKGSLKPLKQRAITTPKRPI